MSREELFALLDDELRQEFMAFAPLDKMRLEKDEVNASALENRSARKDSDTSDADSSKGGEA